MTSRTRTRLLVLLVLVHLVSWAPYQFMDSSLRKWTQGWLEPPPTDGGSARIQLLLVTDEDLEQGTSVWPWNRRTWAEVVDRLRVAGAGAVGLFADLDLERLRTRDPAQDEALLRAQGQGLPVVWLGEGPGESLDRKSVPPHPRYRAAFAGSAPADLVFNRHGLVVGMQLDPEAAAPLLRVVGLDPSVLVAIQGDLGMIPAPASYRGAFQRVSLADLMAGKLGAGSLGGAAVLVGSEAGLLHDIYEGFRGTVPGAEVLARGLAAAQDGRLPRPVPGWLVAALLLASVGAVLQAGRLGQSQPVMLAGAGALALWWGGALLGLWLGPWVLPLARPSVLVLAVMCAELLGQHATPDSELQLADPRVEREALRLFHEALAALAGGDAAEASRGLAEVAAMETTLRSKAEHRLVLALLELGQEDMAALLSQTLEYEKLHDVELEMLARELDARTLYAEARRAYEQLLTLVPGHEEARERLAVLRHELSEFSEADMIEAIARRVLHGRFVDVRLHGRGGAGFLFRVKDRKRKDAELALKILSPLRANDPVWVARFLQEARGIRNLDHPHLVRVFDIFEANLPYYTMEFVSGLSLGERLESAGPVPWSIGLDWVLQAADGLGAAHAAGIVHRDVKPANLLLDHRGRIRVIDFGVARVMHGAAKAVEEGATEAGLDMVGTPRYMAPEQMEGEPAGLSADVYALAVTFYELVTGSAPFESPRAKLVDEPTPPGKSMPVPLADAVLAAMARDPAARPQDMGSLAASWRRAAGLEEG